MGPGTFEASSSSARGAIGATPAVPLRPCGREGAELAATLLGRTSRDVRFLGDRLIPKAGLKTDLIAIAPAAVWVVGVCQATGEVHLSGRAEERRLRAGRTELTDLVAELSRRVELVGEAVATLAPGLPTAGAFCFDRAELPPFRTLTIAGLPLCSVEAIAKRLNVPGPVDEVSGARLARDLGLLFPAC